MHSALFVASVPDNRETWDIFLADIQPKLNDAGAFVRFAENVWLLDVQKNIAQLAWLVARADARGVAYGVLPFERAPEWLPGAFDPRTIQGRSGQPRR